MIDNSVELERLTAALRNLATAATLRGTPAQYSEEFATIQNEIRELLGLTALPK
jgi:hypothetical protein